MNATIAQLSKLMEASTLTPDGRQRVLKGEVTPMRTVPAHIPRPDYADKGTCFSAWRRCRAEQCACVATGGGSEWLLSCEI